MILVNNLCKIYNLHKDQTLFDLITNRGTINKSKIVLHNINLKLELGKIYALFGSNGSGKSTLLKLISEIEYPSSGELKIKSNKKIFSLIDNNYIFDSEFTLEKNLNNLFQCMNIDKKKKEFVINQIFQFTNFKRDYLYYYNKNIDKTELREIILCAGIFCEPDIIIIDEFFNKIKKESTKVFLNLLKKISLNKIIIIVSHDIKLLKNLCNSYIWLDSGKIKKFSEDVKIIDEYLIYKISNTIKTDNPKVITNVLTNDTNNKNSLECKKVDVQNNLIKNFSIKIDEKIMFRKKYVRFFLELDSLLDNSYAYKAGLEIFSNGKTIISQTQSFWKKKETNNKFKLTIVIPNFFLSTQKYNFSVSLKAQKDEEKSQNKTVALLKHYNFFNIEFPVVTSKFLINDIIFNKINSSFS